MYFTKSYWYLTGGEPTNHTLESVKQIQLFFYTYDSCFQRFYYLNEFWFCKAIITPIFHNVRNSKKLTTQNFRDDKRTQRYSRFIETFHYWNYLRYLHQFHLHYFGQQQSIWKLSELLHLWRIKVWNFFITNSGN